MGVLGVFYFFCFFFPRLVQGSGTKGTGKHKYWWESARRDSRRVHYHIGLFMYDQREALVLEMTKTFLRW